MRDLQELAHGDGFDYREGSPHLKHSALRDALLEVVRTEVRAASARGLEPAVLDIGAGHGSFVEPLLAYGCRVTATEMSRPSRDRLFNLYGGNDRFEVVLDATGRLDGLPHNGFAVVLFASVLHHIPDYIAALSMACERIVVGGSLVTLQDPLWCPTVPASTRGLSLAAYLFWRVRRGNVRRGVRTRIRRLRGKYEENNPSDMVEYHVVRMGVNESEVTRFLSERFEHVRMVRYWSAQSAIWQSLGERLSRCNTFAVVASNRKS